MNGVVYFCPVFYVAPDLTQPDQRTKLTRRLARDWSILTDAPVVVSGLSQGGTKRSQYQSVRSIAYLSARRSAVVNTALVYLSHALCLGRLVLRSRVVIVCGDAEAAFVSAAFRRALPRRCRLVVRAEGAASDKARKQTVELRVKRAVERFALRSCDLAVPMGQYTTDFVRRAGVDNSRIELLPFPLAVPLNAAIHPLPLTPTVLFAGRLEDEKGVDYLIRAFDVVRRRITHARLIIAGAGPRGDDLKALADHLQLADSITFTGWVGPDAMADLYREATVLCLPSVWAEGLGMVLVEAGMAGRPVVASALGGVLDIVSDAHNGLTVPPADVAALADALTLVLADGSLALAMGTAGRERATAYLAGYESRRARVAARMAKLF